MSTVRLALLWHMHQPPYREADTGEYLLPWVRLHATRAYHDMASVLERYPGVRCTVNFTPILLEQLEDYVSGRARDRFGELTARPAADLSLAERVAILRSFFMVGWDENVRPVRRYQELLHKRGRDLRGVDLRRVASRFSDGEVTDLQVHFNLAWMGFAAAAEDETVRVLREKGRDYGADDVVALLAAQRRILARIVPRWRALQERGQIELSASPYHHPILPLLCDSDAARRALPHVNLPPRFAHPDDARWHVREAIASHARRFGRAPAGMWPAEGAVSPEALEVLAAEGVSWAASDEGVLLHSLPARATRSSSLYRPWRVAAGAAGEIRMLFRDRPLSDAVGFTYARVPASEAVHDFTASLARIGETWARDGHAGPATVGVFLDGENAWEHYPESGRSFLEQLYGALEASRTIETATMSEATADAGAAVIPRVHSGSWIEASYRVWIGHSEDRIAWTALGRARDALASAERAGTVDAERLARAREHLHRAEASDWFWWYGDDFQTDLAAEFDGLFRGHVVRAALLCGASPPAEVLEPIKRSAPTPGGAASREPTLLVSPRLDGRVTTFFEWQGAGLHRPGQLRGAMFAGAQAFAELHYAFDLEKLYLRLDPAESAARTAEVATGVRVALLVADGAQPAIDFPLSPGGTPAPGTRGGAEVGEAAFADVLEIAIPFSALGVAAGARIALAVQALRGEVEAERLPRDGFVVFSVPDAEFERLHWRV